MQTRQNPESARVAIFGMGYIGCVTAACLARLGHHVTGVDRDELKINAVQDGHAPFYEPGLEELVQEGVGAGRLTATTSTAEGLRNAEIALICVGTPSEKNGNLGLDQLRRVIADIIEHYPNPGHKLILAIRSTAFPGTCEEVAAPLLEAFRGVTLVSNPEFLREGTAIRDFMEPSLVVVGGDDRAAIERVAGIYGGLGTSSCLVSLRTAEMIKYACNAFHAVKISFANEIGTLATRLGVPAVEVMKTLCEDHRLNISATYLTPGFAFGGSCLGKDLRALTYRAGRLDVDLPLLESVLPSNDTHLKRAIDAALMLPYDRVGILGLAFKEDTDDIRESPVVTLLEQLIGKGRNLRVFDPHIRLDAIHGSNKNFILNHIPHIGKLLCPGIEDVLGWAECLVVAQKPSADVRARVAAAGLPVLDLTTLAKDWQLAPQAVLQA